jgi:hypothetical protein
MVSKDYKPKMTPTLIPEQVRSFQDKQAKVPAQIKVSGEYLIQIRKKVGHNDLDLLYAACTGQSLCPEQYWFRDNADTRRILEVPDGA